LSCFVCPWEWKASSPAFSWANWNNISLMELVQTTICSCPFF
jgi:hypothetical protein